MANNTKKNVQPKVEETKEEILETEQPKVEETKEIVKEDKAKTKDVKPLKKIGGLIVL